MFVLRSEGHRLQLAVGWDAEREGIGLPYFCEVRLSGLNWGGAQADGY